LVNGDFVFVMQGQQSRDKFMSSGQNVAVAGTVMGYYPFKRNEANRQAETEEQLRRRLWEDSSVGEWGYRRALISLIAASRQSI
jgi:hypothetical protein